MKLKVAIILEQDISEGGGFQQALTTLQMLIKHQGVVCEFVVVSLLAKNLTILTHLGYEAKHLNYRKIDHYLDKSRLFCLDFTSKTKSPSGKGFCFNTKLERFSQKNEFDLLYFLSPSYLAYYAVKTNFYITVWDTCHRDFPEFPEVRSAFEYRERYYHAILPKASTIIVDSEIGKRNMIRRYAIDDDRIAIVPFEPSGDVRASSMFFDDSTVNIKAKFGIQTDYVFYPAQFWAHKNHIYILQGLAILRDQQGIKISALFCGGDKGNRKAIDNAIKQLKLEDQVYMAGFVDGEIIPFMYKQAIALVMPTYFGPTNIPPLEALALECPVIHSDMPCFRKQLGNAAHYVSMEDPGDLAACLVKLVAGTDSQKTQLTRKIEIIQQSSDSDKWAVIESRIRHFGMLAQTWGRNMA